MATEAEPLEPLEEKDTATNDSSKEAKPVTEKEEKNPDNNSGELLAEKELVEEPIQVVSEMPERNSYSFCEKQNQNATNDMDHIKREPELNEKDSESIFGDRRQAIISDTEVTEYDNLGNRTKRAMGALSTAQASLLDNTQEATDPVKYESYTKVNENEGHDRNIGPIEVVTHKGIHEITKDNKSMEHIVFEENKDGISTCSSSNIEQIEDEKPKEGGELKQEKETLNMEISPEKRTKEAVPNNVLGNDNFQDKFENFPIDVAKDNIMTKHGASITEGTEESRQIFQGKSDVGPMLEQAVAGMETEDPCSNQDGEHEKIYGMAITSDDSGTAKATDEDSLKEIVKDTHDSHTMVAQTILEEGSKKHEEEPIFGSEGQIHQTTTTHDSIGIVTCKEMKDSLDFTSESVPGDQIGDSEAPNTDSPIESDNHKNVQDGSGDLGHIQILNPPECTETLENLKEHSYDSEINKDSVTLQNSFMTLQNLSQASTMVTDENDEMDQMAKNETLQSVSIEKLDTSEGEVFVKAPSRDQIPRKEICSDSDASSLGENNTKGRKEMLEGKNLQKDNIDELQKEKVEPTEKDLPPEFEFTDQNHLIASVTDGPSEEKMQTKEFLNDPPVRSSTVLYDEYYTETVSANQRTEEDVSVNEEKYANDIFEKSVTKQHQDSKILREQKKSINLVPKELDTEATNDGEILEKEEENESLGVDPDKPTVSEALEETGLQKDNKENDSFDNLSSSVFEECHLEHVGVTSIKSCNEREKITEAISLNEKSQRQVITSEDTMEKLEESSILASEEKILETLDNKEEEREIQEKNTSDQTSVKELSIQQLSAEKSEQEDDINYKQASLVSPGKTEATSATVTEAENTETDDHIGTIRVKRELEESEPFGNRIAHKDIEYGSSLEMGKGPETNDASKHMENKEFEEMKDGKREVIILTDKEVPSIQHEQDKKEICTDSLQISYFEEISNKGEEKNDEVEAISDGKNLDKSCKTAETQTVKEDLAVAIMKDQLHVVSTAEISEEKTTQYHQSTHTMHEKENRAQQNKRTDNGGTEIPDVIQSLNEEKETEESENRAVPHRDQYHKQVLEQNELDTEITKCGKPEDSEAQKEEDIQQDEGKKERDNDKLKRVTEDKSINSTPEMEPSSFESRFYDVDCLSKASEEENKQEYETVNSKEHVDEIINEETSNFGITKEREGSRLEYPADNVLTTEEVTRGSTDTQKENKDKEGSLMRVEDISQKDRKMRREIEKAASELMHEHEETTTNDSSKEAKPATESNEKNLDKNIGELFAAKELVEDTIQVVSEMPEDTSYSFCEEQNQNAINDIDQIKQESEQNEKDSESIFGDRSHCIISDTEVTEYDNPGNITNRALGALSTAQASLVDNTQEATDPATYERNTKVNENEGHDRNIEGHIEVVTHKGIHERTDDNKSMEHIVLEENKDDDLAGNSSNIEQIEVEKPNDGSELKQEKETPEETLDMEISPEKRTAEIVPDNVLETDNFQDKFENFIDDTAKDNIMTKHDASITEGTEESQQIFQGKSDVGAMLEQAVAGMETEDPSSNQDGEHQKMLNVLKPERFKENDINNNGGDITEAHVMIAQFVHDAVSNKCKEVQNIACEEQIHETTDIKGSKEVDDHKPSQNLEVDFGSASGEKGQQTTSETEGTKISGMAIMSDDSGTAKAMDADNLKEIVKDTPDNHTMVAKTILEEVSKKHEEEPIFGSEGQIHQTTRTKESIGIIDICKEMKDSKRLDFTSESVPGDQTGDSETRKTDSQTESDNHKIPEIGDPKASLETAMVKDKSILGQNSGDITQAHVMAVARIHDRVDEKHEQAPYSTYEEQVHQTTNTTQNMEAAAHQENKDNKTLELNPEDQSKEKNSGTETITSEKELDDDMLNVTLGSSSDSQTLNEESIQKEEHPIPESESTEVQQSSNTLLSEEDKSVDSAISESRLQKSNEILILDEETTKDATSGSCSNQNEKSDEVKKQQASDTIVETTSSNVNDRLETSAELVSEGKIAREDGAPKYADCLRTEHDMVEGRVQEDEDKQKFEDVARQRAHSEQNMTENEVEKSDSRIVTQKLEKVRKIEKLQSKVFEDDERQAMEDDAQQDQNYKLSGKFHENMNEDHEHLCIMGEEKTDQRPNDVQVHNVFAAEAAPEGLHRGHEESATRVDETMKDLNFNQEAGCVLTHMEQNQQAMAAADPKNNEISSNDVVQNDDILRQNNESKAIDLADKDVNKSRHKLPIILAHARETREEDQKCPDHEEQILEVSQKRSYKGTTGIGVITNDVMEGAKTCNETGLRSGTQSQGIGNEELNEANRFVSEEKLESPETEKKQDEEVPKEEKTSDVGTEIPTSMVSKESALAAKVEDVTEEITEAGEEIKVIDEEVKDPILASQENFETTAETKNIKDELTASEDNCDPKDSALSKKEALTEDNMQKYAYTLLPGEQIHDEAETSKQTDTAVSDYKIKEEKETGKKIRTEEMESMKKEGKNEIQTELTGFKLGTQSQGIGNEELNEANRFVSEEKLESPETKKKQDEEVPKEEKTSDVGTEIPTSMVSKESALAAKVEDVTEEITEAREEIQFIDEEVKDSILASHENFETTAETKNIKDELTASEDNCDPKESALSTKEALIEDNMQRYAYTLLPEEQIHDEAEESKQTNTIVSDYKIKEEKETGKKIKTEETESMKKEGKNEIQTELTGFRSGTQSQGIGNEELNEANRFVFEEKLESPETEKKQDREVSKEEKTPDVGTEIPTLMVSKESALAAKVEDVTEEITEAAEEIKVIDKEVKDSILASQENFEISAETKNTKDELTASEDNFDPKDSALSTKEALIEDNMQKYAYTLLPEEQIHDEAEESKQTDIFVSDYKIKEEQETGKELKTEEMESMKEEEENDIQTELTGYRSGTQSQGIVNEELNEANIFVSEEKLESPETQKKQDEEVPKKVKTSDVGTEIPTSMVSKESALAAEVENATEEITEAREEIKVIDKEVKDSILASQENFETTAETKNIKDELTASEDNCDPKDSALSTKEALIEDNMQKYAYTRLPEEQIHDEAKESKQTDTVVSDYKIKEEQEIGKKLKTEEMESMKEEEKKDIQTELTRANISNTSESEKRESFEERETTDSGAEKEKSGDTKLKELKEPIVGSEELGTASQNENTIRGKPEAQVFEYNTEESCKKDGDKMLEEAIQELESVSHSNEPSHPSDATQVVNSHAEIFKNMVSTGEVKNEDEKNYENLADDLPITDESVGETEDVEASRSHQLENMEFETLEQKEEKLKSIDKGDENRQEKNEMSSVKLQNDAEEMTQLEEPSSVLFDRLETTDSCHNSEKKITAEDNANKTLDAVLVSDETAHEQFQEDQNEAKNKEKETKWESEEIDATAKEETIPNDKAKEFESIASEQLLVMMVLPEKVEAATTMDEWQPKNNNSLSTLTASARETMQEIGKKPGEVSMIEPRESTPEGIKSNALPIKVANENENETSYEGLVDDLPVTDELVRETKHVEASGYHQLDSMELETLEQKEEKPTTIDKGDENGQEKNETSSMNLQNDAEEIMQLEEPSSALFDKLETVDSCDNSEKKITAEDNTNKALDATLVSEEAAHEQFQEDQNAAKNKEKETKRVYEEIDATTKEESIPNDKVKKFESTASEQNLVMMVSPEKVEAKTTMDEWQPKNNHDSLTTSTTSTEEIMQELGEKPDEVCMFESRESTPEVIKSNALPLKIANRNKDETSYEDLVDDLQVIDEFVGETKHVEALGSHQLESMEHETLEQKEEKPEIIDKGDENGQEKDETSSMNLQNDVEEVMQPEEPSSVLFDRQETVDLCHNSERKITAEDNTNKVLDAALVSDETVHEQFQEDQIEAKNKEKETKWESETIDATAKEERMPNDKIKEFESTASKQNLVMMVSPEMVEATTTMDERQPKNNHDSLSTPAALAGETMHEVGEKADEVSMFEPRESTPEGIKSNALPVKIANKNKEETSNKDPVGDLPVTDELAGETKDVEASVSHQLESMELETLNQKEEKTESIDKGDENGHKKNEASSVNLQNDAEEIMQPEEPSSVAFDRLERADSCHNSKKKIATEDNANKALDDVPVRDETAHEQSQGDQNEAKNKKKETKQESEEIDATTNKERIPNEKVKEFGSIASEQNLVMMALPEKAEAITTMDEQQPKNNHDSLSTPTAVAGETMQEVGGKPEEVSMLHPRQSTEEGIKSNTLPINIANKETNGAEGPIERENFESISADSASVCKTFNAKSVIFGVQEKDEEFSNKASHVLLATEASDKKPIDHEHMENLAETSNFVLIKKIDKQDNSLIVHTEDEEESHNISIPQETEASTSVEEQERMQQLEGSTQEVEEYNNPQNMDNQQTNLGDLPVSRYLIEQVLQKEDHQLAEVSNLMSMKKADEQDSSSITFTEDKEDPKNISIPREIEVNITVAEKERMQQLEGVSSEVEDYSNPQNVSNQQPILGDLPVSQYLMDRVLQKEDDKINKACELESEDKIKEKNIVDEHDAVEIPPQEGNSVSMHVEQVADDTSTLECVSKDKFQDSYSSMQEQSPDSIKKTENSITENDESQEGSINGRSSTTAVGEDVEGKGFGLLTDVSSHVAPNNRELASAGQSLESKKDAEEHEKTDLAKDWKTPANVQEKKTGGVIQEETERLNEDVNVSAAIKAYEVNKLQEGGKEGTESEQNVAKINKHSYAISEDKVCSVSEPDQNAKGLINVEENIPNLQYNETESSVQTSATNNYTLGEALSINSEGIKVENREENQEGITESQKQGEKDSLTKESKASVSPEVQQYGLLVEPKNETVTDESSLEERSPTVSKDEKKAKEETDVQMEDVITDEEKDEDEHRIEESKHNVTVTLEAKETDLKPAHKKSHNILSGVGSKVKHSLAKVKKAFTGKSSHSKTVSTR